MKTTTDKLADALRDAYAFIPYNGNQDQAENEKLRARIRQSIAEYDAASDSGNVANVTQNGEVPGVAGQWIPAARCAILAPALHALLDGANLDADNRARLRMLADDLDCGAVESPDAAAPRDPNTTPAVGDELPLNAPRLSAPEPRGDGTQIGAGLSLVLTSQDLRDLCARIDAETLASLGVLPADVSGALVRYWDCDLVEAWITGSARPFDVRTARYTCVRAAGAA